MVLTSGKVNCWTGEEVRLFEQEFSCFIGRQYGVALSNGTVALEIALRALGIGAGDEVVVTARSFIASAACVNLCGARPVFAEVDALSQNVTGASIRKVVTPATKAVIVVHLAGWPCDMDGIAAVAAEFNLKIIEDCAQAHGARYKGKMVGSFGDVASFSFCHDKLMTTGGEGGMLVTDDRLLWERIWSYKEHGKSYEAIANQGVGRHFHWVHQTIGTNGRMTEMQAAIGRKQLEKLPGWLNCRRLNAAILSSCFAKNPALRVTVPQGDVSHAYYKYYVFVRPEKLKAGWDRNRIIDAINREGVPCFSGSCPEIYLEKAFEGYDRLPRQRFPVARELGETSLMFLVHPTLEESDMLDTCVAVEKVFASCAV